MLDTFGFHPLVWEWFTGRFGTPSEPQQQGWPAIRAGRDALIAAPTGSGKTLAAFLVCLDDLLRRALAGILEDETQVIYISPLKALSNDVRKNLEEPLAELRALAASRGLVPPEIRVATRTGDTPASERAKMLRRPPHLLVTTPESLYLLLTSEKGRKLLKPVRTVIVDEIHAVAPNKRGSHLALSLERLDALNPSPDPSPNGRGEPADDTLPMLFATDSESRSPSPVGGGVRGGVRPIRIGLSATQRPLSEIARFLVGSSRVVGGEPDCAIVDAGSRRTLDLGVEVPRDELAAVASTAQWGETFDRVAELIQQHQSTLVFVNTRKMVERLSHELESRLGAEAIGAHHGSMSKEARFESEDKLKKGLLRGVVATASLELGIDVGAVDLVIQIGSPRTFSVALQRIGRSGHWKGATPKGRLFPTTRDELVECAALIRGIERGCLEKTSIPAWPLDVLCQQMVAESACGEVGEDVLYERFRGAYPYRDLPRSEFDRLITLLTEGFADRRGRARAYLHHDGVNRTVKGRRHARITALTSGGAIPDTNSYNVIAEPDGVVVGTLDEHFAVDSGPGDVFLLGNTSWRIRKVEAGAVRVEDAQGTPPNLPFWEGEAPGRSLELSDEVGQLRAALEPRLENPVEAAAWLTAECHLPEAASQQMVAYLAAAKLVLGALPTQTTLIAERFFDEGGGMQLIIHAPFGMRLNRAFGLALRKCFCRDFNFELQAAATDNGILLSLGPQHSFPLETVFEFLSPGPLEDTLVQAALRSPLFAARWRWNATRSLALVRTQGGKRVPPPIQRMRSDDLLAACFPMAAACQEHVSGPLEVPDHPLVKETVRDCLYEAMDYPGLKSLVERMRSGALTLIARDTPEPSALSHEILNSMPYTFLDDAPLEERRARAVLLRRSLESDDARALGALDADAIALVREQVWPEPRDIDELHDALLTLGFVRDEHVPEGWRAWMTRLQQQGRAVRAKGDAVHGWIAAERAGVVRAAWGQLELEGSVPAALLEFSGSADEARTRIVRGWMEHSGPTTSVELARETGLAPSEVDFALLGLESTGLVLRGRFTPGRSEEEWCERTLLARIHRLTLGRLRREIEPTTAADFLRFLFRWQHVQPGTQLHGTRGLSEVIGQLQGFQLAAGAWERDVLTARLRGYQPIWLDDLCLQGEVVWGRFAPSESRVEGAGRRTGPTRALPVALAKRGDVPWLLAGEAAVKPVLSDEAARLLALLEGRGASFFSELVTASKATAEACEPNLWELIGAGAITSDGFAGLRAFVDGERDALPGRVHPLHRGGRWSLLRSAEETTATTAIAKRAELYLLRYGVVFRDMLTRETDCPPWRDLVGHFRRMEARGELRGGRFVSGFSGEQFALPSAVESLRAVRRIPRTGAETVTVSAADPLNLVGVLTPGARVPATLQREITYVDGVPTGQGEAAVG